MTKRTSRHPGGVAGLVDKRIAEVLAQGSLPGLGKKPTKRQVTALTKVHHYISPDQSVEVQWDYDGLIRTVVIACPAAESFDQHIRDLDLGLAAMISRSEVWRILGAPTSSSEPSASRSWDRFDDDRLAINVRYDTAQLSIARVTIMAADSAPEPLDEPERH
jgi:hypothetical protein